MKHILRLFLATILVISVFPSKSFANDIANHQMKTELAYWAKENVILPDSKGNYNPDKMVTRGEFASYITRALKLPENESKTFKDIKKGTTLAKEISAAAAANIISGYPDGTFKPNDKITRQHMASMLHKALRYKKVPLTTSSVKFVDSNKITSNFVDAVATNVYYGIIQGSTTTKGVYFNPQQNATIAHAAAFLYRMQSTITKYSLDTTPGENEEPTPVIPEPDYYYVGYISNSKIVKKDTPYNTFDEVVKIYENSQATTLIFKNDKILKTKVASIAYAADRTSGGDTTTIYLDKDFKKAFTYVVEGSELGYSGGNETYSIVKVGDVTGYAKTSDITIQPTTTLTGRSYYFVSNGRLLHKIYDHITNKYAGEYQVGNAPSFMKAGNNYYSIDGVQFKDASGKLLGTYYNYYQFASVRKSTPYTAEELDSVITTLLAEREILNSSKYANASTKSKLIGLGAYLKQVEEEYKVSALFILAAAMHESDFGMSTNAQTKNNLFGIKVFDSSPDQGSKYAKPEDSILAFMNEYINKNYVPQSGNYANGAVPGTKNTGINVYYASDPFWGSKIAGHMYRMDERLNFKEFKSAPTIGMVVNSENTVNAYADSSTTSTVAYTYKSKPLGNSGLFGFPVIITEEAKGSDGKTWYKVLSDDAPTSSKYTSFVWIPASSVKKITIQ